jgi:Recombination endonuclease VII
MESDPDYRERIRASRRRYGAAHREELRERHRRRMESDPDYRERYREAQRRYRAAHKAQRAERRRFKRRNDPVYRERQLELERFWRRRMYFREVYGITLEDYDIMLARQNGACAICSRIPDKRLAVDHCHTSGKVRGLLCAKCNSGLAFYEDNPRYLLAAVSYLQASRSDEE